MSALLHVFTESRPVDLVIVIGELLVLLLIAYELVARAIHKRSVAKRLNELFYAIAEGQELQATARQIAGERSPGAGEWSHAVQEWIKVTRKTLEHCSAQAVISFMHDPDLTLTHLGSIAALSEYESLVLRLNNLRCIMEHPEAYFPR